MNNSNYTLRFSRTSREAFGHQVHFETSRKADRYVLAVAIVAIAFIVGMIVGGA